MAEHSGELSRRQFWTLAGFGVAACGLTSVAEGEEQPDAGGLKSELLLRLDAEVDLPQAIGKIPQGNRQIFYAKGGTFEGPKLQGTALAGGGDWLLVRPDGVGEIDVRGTLQTDDGELIYAQYRGILNFQTGYFRTTPRFETSSEKYSWLNNIIAVGVGRSDGQKVHYDIYQIL